MYTVLYSVFIVFLLGCTMTTGNLVKDTSERIREYNYPVEMHEVVTSDGYVIEIFRIPYSPKLQNANQSRPVVLLQHGILSSSDFWILNGPDNALAYLFVDAGFDVWLGNQRGNVYGRKNVNISPDTKKFWNFSWHELGILDNPAIIDFILQMTKQDALHYVGHSQGSTIFFVLMSEKPEYNSKIKTAHMLAPIAFIKPTILSMYMAAPTIGRSPFLSNVLESYEISPRNDFMAFMLGKACSFSIMQTICLSMAAINGEKDFKHFNMSLLPSFLETSPAGSSSGQMIHLIQLAESGYFRKYDHGTEENQKLYGQPSPPNYYLENINTPVRLYYSSSDDTTPLDCLKKLVNSLPNMVDIYKIPIAEWNHLDFGYALEVKEVLYDKIIKAANYFEKTGKQLKIT